MPQSVAPQKNMTPKIGRARMGSIHAHSAAAGIAAARDFSHTADDGLAGVKPGEDAAAEMRVGVAAAHQSGLFHRRH